MPSNVLAKPKCRHPYPDQCLVIFSDLHYNDNNSHDDKDD